MSKQQAANTHRVVVEFDGESVYTPKLVHPEGGCITADGPECWVQGWFDEQGRDLLVGRIEVTVEPEWDGDGCLLHIVAAREALEAKP